MIPGKTASTVRAELHGSTLTKVRQALGGPCIEAIEAHVRGALDRVQMGLPKGARVALAVGSRGIANLDRIVRTTVQWLGARGYRPFLVPAMGSHGGATSEGQRAVLEGYGITADAMGAEIVSSLDVVELPRGECPHRLYYDQQAAEADATIIINRIKPHTDYHGTCESGLLKMLVIGLGKHAQALEIHGYGIRGLRELIVAAARQVLRHGNVVLGLGIVENGREETAIVEALLPHEFEREEPRLLEEARRMLPRLPVSELDLLVVDEFGKDVSGVGIDTNVIGRLRIAGVPEPATPRISSIVLADLTEASHGNALGMGLADVTTERVLRKIDFRATYENVVTSSFLERGRMPLVAGTCDEAIRWALRGCGITRPEQARIARIKNTRSLETVAVSSALLAELRGRTGVTVTDEEIALVDAEGDLPRL